MAKENFRVSGQKIELPKPSTEWSFETRPGGWTIAKRTTSQGAERKRFFLTEGNGKLSFSIDGFLFFGSLESQSHAASGSGGSELDLNAQFPGKVRKILVTVGEKLEEGAPLMLLEAMKMEFSVKAPYSGTVERIRVKEGQQISSGDRLLDLKK